MHFVFKTLTTNGSRKTKLTWFAWIAGVCDCIPLRRLKPKQEACRAIFADANAEE
jgi:hypothetical protein